ncbi:MAG: beta-ketoacyl synthase, partial [Acidobacteria bacterium]|nr:beta-ketoacyl synthase [Acidobacteriota bacterium]
MKNGEPQHAQDGIAIIGMTGRFPGAPDVERFWRNLHDGRSGITFFSDEELLAEGVPRDLFEEPLYVRARGVIDDVAGFDAKFFGFSPREADITDPQQRIFLECCWEALEDAAYVPSTFPGRIALFGGASWSTYFFDIYSRPDIWRSLGAFQIAIGNEKDHLTTRVSYKLNLRGPSVTVQTACSSSLVAVTLACQSLTAGQADIGLAGGVSISIPQKVGYLYQEGMILSSDGHCRAFDAGAQGTVGGNGVGIVVLKRLADALADGDRIRAVIRGWGMNNDGSAKVGYTAPSIEGQAEAIAAAHALAGVPADSISYVETHGTGTPLGDPIEVAALTDAFRRGTDRVGFCAIGSVKTNIGHLDAAAGVAGLIKTTLALENRTIPASLDFQAPNPVIPFATSPFFVNTERRKWTVNGTPRRAGVSSFGIGGTNAHVVLEEAPPRIASGPSRPECLLVLSAQTESALARAATNLAAHLAAHPELNVADVAFTLQNGRTAFAHRRAIVCRTAEDAVAALQLRDGALTGARGTEPPRVVFTFPGQGSQYAGMLAGLYESEPVYREQVDRLLGALEPELAGELRAIVQSAEALDADQTKYAQPALFIVEYALARLWMAWGIVPDAVIGHSVGELTAACIAGVFTPEDA